MNKVDLSAATAFADEHLQNVIKNKQTSIKDRNMVLRRIIAEVENRRELDEDYRKALEILLSSVSNMTGCEKYFYEVMIALHVYGNAEQKQLAEKFHVLVNETKSRN